MYTEGYFTVNTLLVLWSAIVSYMLFGVAWELSCRIGAVDLPNGRKIHKVPMPRAGGLCFFLPFSAAMLFLRISPSVKLFLLSGASFVFLVGLSDDIFSVSPLHKLAGQAAAAAIPVFFGLNFYTGRDPLLRASFGCLTFFWILLLTNAVNLSDGLDGLAAGESLSFCLTLSVLSVICGNADVAAVSCLLASSLVGFIPHNRHPAKIFMGDCGSLFIGFSLSVLSVIWLSESCTLPHTAAILLLFLVPIADTVQSFFRRLRKRKSPFSADKGHFHHRLLNVGFTESTAAYALVTLSVLFALFSVLLML